MKLSEKIIARKTIVEEEAEMDFEKADISMIWNFLSKRLDRKPAKDSSDLYQGLCKEFAKAMQDMPNGNQKLKAILKNFKSEML